MDGNLLMCTWIMCTESTVTECVYIKELHCNGIWLYVLLQWKLMQSTCSIHLVMSISIRWHSSYVRTGFLVFSYFVLLSVVALFFTVWLTHMSHNFLSPDGIQTTHIVSLIWWGPLCSIRKTFWIVRKEMEVWLFLYGLLLLLSLAWRYI